MSHTSPSPPLPSLPNSIYSHSPSNTTPASSVDDVRTHRPLHPGVYVPTLCFFHPATEDLDLPTIVSHAVRLARAGVTGLTTQGSNGEAVHLSTSERILVTSTTRRALTSAGFGAMPLIVGCGAQSTRETVALCHDAFDAGGDYALVLPPSYYKPLLSRADLLQFFTDVATASPIPVLVYNYPAAVAGTDLSSDDLVLLAQHPNIVGCKLTCGNTGKLTRVAAATHAATMESPGSGFMCLGGSADFTLQMLVAGGSGTICGLANVVPRLCVEVMELWRRGEVQKARELQNVVAKADWLAIKGGIAGTKSALRTWFGYGGFPRRPLPRGDDDGGEGDEAWREVVEIERGL